MGEVELTEVEYDRLSKPPSTAVVEAIASVEDTDPAALSDEYGVTLYDHVDPDALDRLVSAEHTSDIEITLGLDGYTVWVTPAKVLVAHTEMESGGAR